MKLLVPLVQRFPNTRRNSIPFDKIKECSLDSFDGWEVRARENRRWLIGWLGGSGIVLIISLDLLDCLLS